MMLAPCHRRHIALALLVGCGPSVDAGDGAEANGEASSDGSKTSGTDEGSAEGATTQSLADCGDANIDPGEACDDGNEMDGDGCNRNCTVSGSLLWTVEAAEEQCGGFSGDVAGNLYALTGVPSMDGDGTVISRLDSADGEEVWNQMSDTTPDGGGFGALLGLRTMPGLALVGSPGASPSGSWRQIRDEDGGLVLEVTDEATEVVRAVGIGASDDLWLFAEVFSGADLTARALERYRSDGVLDWRQEFEDLPPTYRRGEPLDDGDMIVIGYVDPSDAAIRFRASGETAWVRPIPVDNGQIDDLAVAPTGEIFVTRYELPPPGSYAPLEVRRYGGDGALVGSFPHSVAELPDANYIDALLETDYAGGVVVLSQVEAEIDSGKDRWVVARYLVTGEQMWAHLVPPLNQPAHGALDPCGIVVDPFGRVVVAVTTHDDNAYTTVIHALAL